MSENSEIGIGEIREARLKDWPLLKGLSVGSWIILDDGIKGGQGRYYRVKGKDSDEEAGCKVLHAVYAAGEDSLARFQQEGRMLIEFEHDNIVKGLESGHQRGIHYIIMRHLEGETLTTAMRRGSRLPVDCVYRVMAGIADALRYFHDKGYVHRDIKPSNIIWCRDRVARLIDLGTFWDEIEPNPRERELIMGTVQYMSPEQIAGNNDRIDYRSDCYSFGMTILHLMSGHPPFPDKDPKVVLTKQVTKNPEFRPEVTERFCADAIFIVRKMIEKYPYMRYQSPRELLEDIGKMDRSRSALASDMDTTVAGMKRIFDFEGTELTPEPEEHSSRGLVAQSMLRAVDVAAFSTFSLAIGEVLFYEGDTDDEVFVLKSGELEILQGGRLLAKCREPGSIFGEMAALLGEARSATIRARTEAKLVMLTRSKYLSLLRENPELTINTAKLLGSRLSKTNNKLVAALARLGLLEKHILRLFARKKVEAFSAEQVKALQTQLLDLLKDPEY